MVLRSRKQAPHHCTHMKVDNLLEKYIPGNSFRTKLRRLVKSQFLISEGSVRKCYNQMSMTMYLFEKEKHLSCHFFIIHPYSLFRRFWEFIVMIEIFTTCTIRPFVIAQLTDDALCSEPMQYLGLTVDTIEIVDILLRFATGYVEREDNKVTLEARKIFYHTLKQPWFYIDLIVAFPLCYFIYILSYDCFNLACLFFLFFKIVRINIFQNYMRHMAKVWSWSDSAFRVTIIIIWLIVGTQMLANVYYVVLTTSNTPHYILNITGPLDNAVHRHFVILYMVTSIMFSHNGMIGIISVESPQDHIFCSIAIVICYLGGVILVGLLLHNFSCLKTSKSKYIEVIQAVKKYMAHKDLPKNLQRKILMYFEFRYQNHYFQEKEILRTMSLPLRRSILSYIGLKFLKDHDCIFSRLPDELLCELCLHLKLMICLTGEVILAAGERGTKIFFISSGTMASYNENGVETEHLHEGQSFGMSAYVESDNRYLASIVAIEICEIYSLHVRDFMEVMDPYPEYKMGVLKLALRRRTKMLKRMEREKALKDYYHLDTSEGYSPRVN